jgi:hypothetical protein
MISDCSYTISAETLGAAHALSVFVAPASTNAQHDAHKRVASSTVVARNLRHCNAAMVIATQRWSLQRSDGHCNAAMVIATQPWSLQRSHGHCNASGGQDLR